MITERSGASRRALDNPVVASGLLRLVALVPTALATLITTRVLIEHYGIAIFDAFSVIVSMMTLLSVNNLGAGAAITSALAGRADGDDYAERVALTAVRVSLLAGLASALASVLITVADAWTGVAGAAVHSNLAFGIAMVIISLSFAPLLGQSVLLGANKNHVFVALQALLTPLMMTFVLVLVPARADGGVAIVVPAVALFAVSIATTATSARVARFPWGRILRRVPYRRRFPGASIRAVSTPMLVIQLTTPIALQSDRIALSHLGTATQLAAYTVCVQLFAPVSALVTSAAQPLWPMFAAARGRGAAPPPMRKIMTLIGAGAVAICVVVVALATPLGHLVGSQAIDLGVRLPVANALAVLTYAATFPIAMAILDGPGLRLCAVAAAVALPLNVGLSIALVDSLGASAPLFATALVTVVVQTVPFAWYFRRTSGALAYAR